MLGGGGEGFREGRRQAGGQDGGDLKGLRGLQARELARKGGREGGEEGDREEVGVEEVGFPVVSVLEVDVFYVGAHPGR